MKLIAGLGNYPKEYDLTRHNIGFMSVDNFAIKYNATFKTESKFKAEIAITEVNNEKIILAKPLTYMNLSGEAINKISSFYKINPKEIFIIFDDISLNLGTMRFKSNGSDGGHNGIKSIIQNLGTKDFPRLKIGIGPQPDFLKSESFVLQKFSNQQMPLLNKVILKSTEAIDDYICLGITEAQNKYNGFSITL